MIALIQRVTEASVHINRKEFSSITYGYVILLGIDTDDMQQDIDILISKILNLRIMDDDAGKMNKSILDTKGQLLIVSQFTLCADTSAGRRPSYINAMKPDEAKKMYRQFIEEISKSGLTVNTGEFGAMMEVKICNHGPVTILLDSKKL